MHILPNDVLYQLLLPLSTKEVLNVARCSKALHKRIMQDDNENFWKKFCQKYLDNPQPYINSFKNRFKLIHNWLNLNFAVNSLGVSERLQIFENRNFAIAEYNQFFEVVSSYKENQFGQKHMILGANQNVLSKIVCLPEEKDNRTVRIAASTVYEKTVVVLDSWARIFFYDLQTNALLHTFTDKDINYQGIVNWRYDETYYGALEYKGNELITYYENEVKIWSKEGELLNKFDAEKLFKVLKIKSTANYIFCQTCKEEEQVFAKDKNELTYSINKNGKAFKLLSTPEFIPELNSIASTQTHIAMMSKNGTIQIFEDKKDELVCVNKINVQGPLNNFPRGHLQIYDNWLLGTKAGHFFIIDLKSAKRIVDHPFPANARFVTNGKSLLVQVPVKIEKEPLKYYYYEYDFNPDPKNRQNKQVKPLGIEKQKDNKTTCNVQ